MRQLKLRFQPRSSSPLGEDSAMASMSIFHQDKNTSSKSSQAMECLNKSKGVGESFDYLEGSSGAQSEEGGGVGQCKSKSRFRIM